MRSHVFESHHARYSFVAARPFLTFRSFGSRCEIWTGAAESGYGRDLVVQFGNPWRVLEQLMARYELLDQLDLPFPLGGCFGFWGYDLRQFVEPKLRRRAVADLELPDCQAGFYDSLVVFDHLLAKTWIISTGLDASGARSGERAQRQAEWWHAVVSRQIESPSHEPWAPDLAPSPCEARAARGAAVGIASSPQPSPPEEERENELSSTVCRDEFIRAVRRAQTYIQCGDVYQVNLAQRFGTDWPFGAWDLFENLSAVSPAPFCSHLDCGDFQIVSSSPELFLSLSGSRIETRPIKGTRPRSADPTRDAQLSYELQTSSKEMAELIMITDLLRNDLGKVCDFGSVHVRELARLERYAQVQHLVSTIEGQLRAEVPHFSAFASCFPGGSVTGAPKFRAMEIIDELEPVARGPYTGALGYLGFNRESQLSILIRTAICKGRTAFYYSGAGIVADSDPEAEYEETLAKARGFFQAVRLAKHSNEASSDPRMNTNEHE